jgi:hypothetical protein
MQYLPVPCDGGALGLRAEGRELVAQPPRAGLKTPAGDVVGDR